MAGIPQLDALRIAKFCRNASVGAVTLDTEIEGNEVTLVEHYAPERNSRNGWIQRRIAKLQHDDVLGTWALLKLNEEDEWEIHWPSTQIAAALNEIVTNRPAFAPEEL